MVKEYGWILGKEWKFNDLFSRETRPLFTHHIKDGGIIPHWYGFAYHDFDTDSASYMPIPINLCYVGWRWFKYNILRKIKFEWPRELMLWERRIYRLGQIDGYDAGRFTSVMSEGDELESVVKEYFTRHPTPQNIAIALKQLEEVRFKDTTINRMLEGVDPHTNPGWNKLYKAGE
jgi:hypothetical protein